MSGDAPKLRMSAISKTFPGVNALDDVSFETRAGEIVGLVGVNGAGKSTLMNIFGGIYQPDKGKIFIDGERSRSHSPKEAESRNFIHPSGAAFFASQTVAENIFISHLFTNPSFRSSSTRVANREARRHLETLGSDIEPDQRMGSLSVGERQIVEIARALAMGSDIVIFDEPTSSLSFKEKETLFKVVRSLKREGKAIIYITHFLDEMLELCDNFVVLRNGSCMARARIKDVTKDDIVRLIIGRDIATVDRPLGAMSATVARQGEKSAASVPKDIAFDMRRGEILGLWGLMGSGERSLFARSLAWIRSKGGASSSRTGRCDNRTNSSISAVAGILPKIDMPTGCSSPSRCGETLPRPPLADMFRNSCDF